MGCMGWQGPGHPAPMHGGCACPHAAAQALQPASPGQVWGSAPSLSTRPRSTAARSTDAGFSLLPLGNTLPLRQSHIVRLPSPWKSPGAPLCQLSLSMGHFTHQEQYNLLFPGVLSPPSLGISGQRVSYTPNPGAMGASRSMGHFCSHCIAACMHEGQAGLCSYHGREQAASCRKGPRHRGSRTGPYAAFHQHWLGPSLQIARCLHTWLH